MKIIKRFLILLLIYILSLIFTFSVKADDLSAAVQTGDREIIWIIIAAAACIITAFITAKLTRNKNKYK